MLPRIKQPSDLKGQVIGDAELPYWCDEAAFADWEQSTEDWPSWEVAAEKLDATGRLVNVLHPSVQHKAGIVEIS